MSAPFLATITVLGGGGGAQPKGGGTHLAMITPLGGPHAGHDLPEMPGAVDPGWGVTPPVDPGFGGGVPVPPSVWPPQPLPPLPPDLETEVVVAVHRPGQEWEVKSRPAAMPKG